MPLVRPPAAVPTLYTHALWLELAQFVGLAGFRGDWLHANDDKVLAERARYPTADAFYRETDVYLYHGLGFWLEGWKRPYLSLLLHGFGNRRATVLDYGCGCGYDGVWLTEAGYHVSFADLPSRSLAFCRWRLAHRGLHAPVYELPAQDATIPRHDVVWCMDVLEHLPPAEQAPLLAHLATLGDAVIVTLVHDPAADGRVHHPVDMDGLTAWVEARWPLLHYDYYPQPNGGFVRVLFYGPAVASCPDASTPPEGAA